MAPINNEDKNRTREQRLEDLKDATKRLAEAKAAKKADAKVHKDNITGIEGEINEIMQQLKD